MSCVIPADRAMRELEPSNGLLDDPAAMERFWEDQGYLYFQGVFSEEGVADVRNGVIEVLTENGFVVPGAQEPVWTGKGFVEFGVRPKAIYDLPLAETFFERPEVKDFLARVFGEEPVFIPIEVYRFNPPVSAAGAEPFLAPPHQDGYFNQGIPFRICWIPLMDIDEALGGLAIAPGVLKRGYLHNPDEPPNFPIPTDAIPDDAWRRANFRVGDILMVHRGTPHGGMPNHSDKLRLTMDLRIAKASDTAPVFGEVAFSAPDSITVRTGDGSQRVFTVDDETFIRATEKSNGARIPRNELSTYWTSGKPVIVAPNPDDETRAAFIRNPI